MGAATTLIAAPIAVNAFDQAQKAGPAPSNTGPKPKVDSTKLAHDTISTIVLHIKTQWEAVKKGQDESLGRASELAEILNGAMLEPDAMRDKQALASELVPLEDVLELVCLTYESDGMPLTNLMSLAVQADKLGARECVSRPVTSPVCAA